MRNALYCPQCGSTDLAPHGSPSLLDGKKGKRCLGCGQVFAPRRSRLLLGGIFVLALGVTGVCVAFLALGEVWIEGLVAGPVTMAFTAVAMFSRMPASGPPPGG